MHEELHNFLKYTFYIKNITSNIINFYKLVF